MPKPTAEWKVHPHGPLEELEPGIMTVEGELPMPLMDIPRRMTVIRLRDGRLVIWSAVALDEASMEKLEGYGPLAFLIVPSDHHRVDAAAYKNRFPDLQVVAPPGSRHRVDSVVEVDSTAPDFGDPGVRFVAVPGTGEEEAALVVRRLQGTTLVVNDLIGNIRRASGFGGWVLRRMGLAGNEAQVPKAVALLIVHDKQALATQLKRWAELPVLRRIIVSHGEIIESKPAAVLHELAHSLEG